VSSADEAVLSTAIVVPCYNEAGRLDVEAFGDFVAGHPWLSLVFVDDGSTDGTAASIEAIRERSPERVVCLSLDSNSGKGEAVRRGVLQAIGQGHDLIGFWDADLATPLDEIDRFRSRFEHDDELQMLLGSRVKLLGKRIERSELRHYCGRVAATLVSWILRLPVYDTQCGAKLFRVGPGLPTLFAERFLSRWAFDVEILARWLIHRDEDVDVHRAVVEMPVRQWIDVPGSKLRMRDFVRAPFELCRIRWRYGSAIRKRNRAAASPD
jgi:glycosyltransferase involved in cell wall biosynthesis